MSRQQVDALVNAALADPAVDLAMPVMMSLAMREGMRREAVNDLRRGDYHPSVDGVPGSLTYRAGGQVQVVGLSPESEALVAAYLVR